MKAPPSKGFCFCGLTLDGTTLVYVNVCGHEEIMLPRGPSGAQVDEEFIDKNGVDNLQIPIAVSDPVEHKLNSSSRSGGSSDQEEEKKKKPIVQEVNNNNSTTAGGGEKKKKSASPQNKLTRHVFVEVVVHKMISDRCRGVWNTGGEAQKFDENCPPMRKMLIIRIAKLAMDWVQRETGITLHPDSIRLVFNTAYQHAPNAKKNTGAAASGGEKLPSQEEMMAFMKQMSEKGTSSGTNLGGADLGSDFNPFAKLNNSKKNENKQPPVSPVVPSSSSSSSSSSAASATSFSSSNSKSNNNTLESEPTSIIFSATQKKQQQQQEQDEKRKAASPTTKNSSLIQEVSSSAKKSSVMKKGFLSNTNGSLYGEKGTEEGVLPEGAGDPLGYMPKSFREKCKVVDTRGMSQEEINRAATGASGGVFPSNDSEYVPPKKTSSAVGAAASSSVSASASAVTHQFEPPSSEMTTSTTSAATKTSSSSTSSSSSSSLPKMSFSSPSTSASASASAASSSEKPKIQIEEIDEERDSNEKKETNQPEEKKEKKKKNRELKQSWKSACSNGWSLSRAELSTSSEKNELILVLNPGAKKEKGDFKVSELDLEVLPCGLSVSTISSEEEENSSSCSSNNTCCFTLGENDLDSQDSLDGFSPSEWNQLLLQTVHRDSSNAKEEEQEKRLSLVADSAKAKYKKASRELTITLPLQ